MQQLLCPWEQAQYFVYSSNIPTLFFYSHLPVIIVALLIGFLVFHQSKKSKVGNTLLLVSILFSLWCLFDLFLWATNRPDVVMFFWSLQILIEPLVYLLSFYLTYLFIKKEDLVFGWKIFWILLYLPIVLLLPSKFNLLGVDLAYCTAIEGFIAQYFTYVLEGLFILSIIVFTILSSKKITNSEERVEARFFGLGIILFLLAFSSGNIIGSFTENWNLAQIGLIGMPIFVAFLAYLIIRFHTFNVKLFATQVFILGLMILIGAQLFISKSTTNFILNLVTFITVLVFGYLLINSVKKEIKQREELQKLNTNLRNVIQQRESLVHLITHKVKGSFTRTKYIFAEMLAGSFGELSPEIKKIAEKGLESDATGIQTIDLVLNASNLESGIVKYDMKKIDLTELIEKVVSEKRLAAEAKNLKLESHSKSEPSYVLGDVFWLKEVLNNLLDNAIKYTKEGHIQVGLENKEGKILFSVKDTGVGITPEDMKNLFTEGGRGKESIKTNVDSTGYGLYSVKLIVDAHGGKVWAESPGKDKGSIFYVELGTI